MLPHISDRTLLKMDKELMKLYMFRRTAVNDSTKQLFTKEIIQYRKEIADFIISSEELDKILISKL